MSDWQKARCIAECLLGGQRHYPGELLELTTEQFQRLRKARCVVEAPPTPPRRPPVRRTKRGASTS